MGYLQHERDRGRRNDLDNLAILNRPSQRLYAVRSFNRLSNLSDHSSSSGFLLLLSPLLCCSFPSNVFAISTEWIARKLADYLTAETGVTVVFESAIVPKWKDSRISFKNVFISRRAHGGDIDSLLKERKALAQKKASNFSNVACLDTSTLDVPSFNAVKEPAE